VHYMTTGAEGRGQEATWSMDRTIFEAKHLIRPCFSPGANSLASLSLCFWSVKMDILILLMQRSQGDEWECRGTCWLSWGKDLQKEALQRERNKQPMDVANI
jgi:hypothetical protein